MNRQDKIREIAALRQAFHANDRLRLEFLGGFSKLLREYGISVGSELLRELIFSVPEETLSGAGPASNGGDYGPQRAEKPPPGGKAKPPRKEGKTPPKKKRSPSRKGGKPPP